MSRSFEVDVLFRFSDMKLSTKLPLLIAIPALAVVLIAGLLRLQTIYEAMEEQRQVSYRSFVDDKSSAVENWLGESQLDLMSLATVHDSRRNSLRFWA